MSYSDISKSVFGLAKNNNGFFKSEKQAGFLIEMLEKYDGCIGHANSGYNSCPIFAEYDGQGIAKIVKSAKRGNVVMFERKQDGVLTSIEKDLLKKLKRQARKLEKQISDRENSFNDGSYNSSGDVSTYTESMIDMYNQFQMQYKQELQRLISKINFLKSQV